MQPSRPVLIMAGGTGGHIYPALAIADYLRARGIPLIWLGTRDGMETKIVPPRDYPFLTINVWGLRGKGIIHRLRTLVGIAAALCQSMRLFISYKPAVVLGMGGFASGPGGLAAWLMRIPLCIHEQNAVAGLTNRLLAPLANIIMQAFPNTFPVSRQAELTGNPVRQEISTLAKPSQRFCDRDNSCLRVLIIGGSLGAKALNEMVPVALAELADEIKFQVKHQTGARHLEITKNLYLKLNIAAELRAFIEDMATVYAWADLVLCRAGAMTVAELAAVGVAAILIPYPHAVDDHQTANARYLSDNGAAILMPQAELGERKLAQLLRELHRDRTKLLHMAKKSRQLAQPKATERIADLCLETAYG